MDEPECCGNPVIGVNEAVPFQMANEKLEHIKSVKAQALITVCPYCHIMYDLNQPRIERTFNKRFGIPVLHYTQLLGLAMNFSPEELAMNKLRVKPTKILEQILQ
jgi:heterodisulfide reductase subunit B